MSATWEHTHLGNGDHGLHRYFLHEPLYLVLEHSYGPVGSVWNRGWSIADDSDIVHYHKLKATTLEEAQKEAVQLVKEQLKKLLVDLEEV